MDIGKVNLTQYPEVGRGLTLQEEEDLLKLQLSAEKMYRALKVILESKKLKSLLEVNDKMAFDQARQAVEMYEDNLFHL
jgi:hypothetical protein